jgi:protein-disulfide isomerase
MSPASKRPRPSSPCGIARLLGVALLLFLLAPLGAPRAEKEAPIPWSKLKGGSSLSEIARLVAEESLRAIECYRGCRGTVARCLAATPRVKAAWRLAEYILFLAEKGLARDEIEEAVKARRDSLLGKEVQVTIEGMPVLGDPGKAKIVVVEFADFECPHCASVSPVLEKIVAEKKGLVALVFKPYPLRTTGGPLLAAQASLAAHRQGKFFPMAKLLFADPKRHTKAGLEAVAQEAGCDLGRFRAAMTDVNILKQIEKVKIEGVRLGIKGTPAIWVNRRELLTRRDETHLRDRIEEEIDRLDEK